MEGWFNDLISRKSFYLYGNGNNQLIWQFYIFKYFIMKVSIFVIVIFLTSYSFAQDVYENGSYGNNFGAHILYEKTVVKITENELIIDGYIDDYVYNRYAYEIISKPNEIRTFYLVKLKDHLSTYSLSIDNNNLYFLNESNKEFFHYYSATGIGESFR